MNEDVRAGYLETGIAQGEPLSGPERSGLDALRAALSNPATWSRPPDLAAEILGRIREEAASSERAAETVAEAAEGGAAGTAATPDLVAGPPRPRRRLLAAAAVVVALAAATAVALALASGQPAPSHEFPLDGSLLAPAAAGRVEATGTDSGVTIRLDVEGLPQAPEGHYYEAWLRGSRGLVPIGTFRAGGEVMLMSGVPIEDHPTLSVTLEPDDADTSSSGRVVLSGNASG